ncbi:MAG TPA: SRPBCC family protein [Acidimicrobiales bacterium]|nr:SRPBCC family protein [Acidimicrobiales bacterium]
MTRYADGPTVVVSIDVDAPATRVWELVTDINVPARFSPEFQGADWLDDVGDAPRLGARFVGRNGHAAQGEWETTSWVNRLEPLRAFGWAVSDPEEPSATWWFELDSADDDNGRPVRLRQGARMGPAPSGLSIAIAAMPDKEERIVARRLEEWQRNMQATLEGIKALAESRRAR